MKYGNSEYITKHRKQIIYQLMSVLYDYMTLKSFIKQEKLNIFN